MGCASFWLPSSGWSKQALRSPSAVTAILFPGFEQDGYVILSKSFSGFISLDNLNEEGGGLVQVFGEELHD
jgi:hypothetical protein